MVVDQRSVAVASPNRRQQTLSASRLVPVVSSQGVVPWWYRRAAAAPGPEKLANVRCVLAWVVGMVRRLGGGRKKGKREDVQGVRAQALGADFRAFHLFFRSILNGTVDGSGDSPGPLFAW